MAEQRTAIDDGCLGLELGSTQVKACLVDAAHPSRVLAVGTHEWANEFVDGVWTYALDDVWTALRGAYAALMRDAAARHGSAPHTFRAIGVSAMMHGYLAFDAQGGLLVPFRTWRNTSTGPAASELRTLLGVNIPLRWSIAHLHQAVLDREPHMPRIDHVTTLAGHVHERLTGRRVLGADDASGMFPIDPATVDYDAAMLRAYDRHVGTALPRPLRDLLPVVLPAGADAGALTAAGARLLDPTGALEPGIPFCPPEGDAATGMVATNAVAPRTGNVSVGTSVFATIVLERPLAAVHDEIDVVATPAGAPAAMVHCNNGASELGAWAGVFAQFAAAIGADAGMDDVYRALFAAALDAEADAGGVFAYNQLAGEPVAGLDEGRPMIVRTPDSALTLANLMRAQLYGVFGALALGMRVLHDEGVGLDRMYAHGGVFRTVGVAQRMLAAALDAPVAVAATASEGGAWGAAVLAAFRLAREPGLTLAEYLDRDVFAGSAFTTVRPEPRDAAGFARHLERYRGGLAAVRAAGRGIPPRGEWS